MSAAAADPIHEYGRRAIATELGDRLLTPPMRGKTSAAIEEEMTTMQNERRAASLALTLLIMRQQKRQTPTSVDAEFAWAMAEFADKLYGEDQEPPVPGTSSEEISRKRTATVRNLSSALVDKAPTKQEGNTSDEKEAGDTDK